MSNELTIYIYKYFISFNPEQVNLTTGSATPERRYCQCQLKEGRIEKLKILEKLG